MTKSIEELRNVEFTYTGTEDVPSVINTELYFINNSKLKVASIGLNLFVDQDKKVYLDIAELTQAIGLPMMSFRVSLADFTPKEEVICLNYHATRGLKLEHGLNFVTNEVPYELFPTTINYYLSAGERKTYKFGDPSRKASRTIGSSEADFAQLGVIDFMPVDAPIVYAWDSDDNLLGKIQETITCQDYFLRWHDRLGGTRCMYFDYKPEYTEKVERKYMTDRTNSEKQYGAILHGEWKLTRRNLSDAQYKALESLFWARDVELYERSENKWIPVKIGADFVEKYYKKDKELLKLELTAVELQKHVCL